MNGFARLESIATVDWLAANIERPEVRVVDVRWRPDGTSADVFAAGHLPGATHLDWSTGLVDTGADGRSIAIAGPDQVAAAASAAGIGNGMEVVLYDDTASLYAARTWWTFRVYGFESARILDGGLPAWVEAGRPVSTMSPAPTRVTFTPRLNARQRLTTADMRGLLGTSGVVIVDARAPAEFRGMEGNARRLGHIPGAINVPVGLMTEPGSQRLRDSAGLRSLLLKANVSRGPRIVCYDGSGVAAAKLAWILMLLGHEDVGVYDGGWADWGDRLDLPVER